MSKPDNPGVRFPPPFLYAAGILVGWLLHRAMPLGITGRPSTAREAIAWLFGLSSAALVAPALWRFFRARTGIIPHHPATELVTSGPYRFTRNPMYVGLAALQIAIGLVLDSWWVILTLPVVLLAIRHFVIAREEAYLSRAFPVDYAAYRQRVRRWL